MAVFFPGEVVRLLDLGDIEYDQLRSLYRLSRVTRGLPEPGREWSRFSLADLACVEVLIKLGGGREALRSGRRLILGDVKAACQALREAGVENPLLEVELSRIDRRRLVARVSGYVFEPATGQLVLEDVDRQIEAFLEERLINDLAVRRAIRREGRRVKPTKRTRAAVTGEWGTLGSAGHQSA